MIKILKTKVGASIGITLLSMIIIGTSYGIFVVTSDKYKASELLISNLLYGIEIKTTGGNETINNKTVTTNKTSTILVTITSLNIK